VSLISGPVSDTVDTLVLDPLGWIGANPRPYAEVLEAWRNATSGRFLTKKYAKRNPTSRGGLDGVNGEIALPIPAPVR
jgi:hypothetical protein